MKRLFVCCDGTWNSESDEFQGVPVPTNVVRFYNAIDIGPSTGTTQLAYYHVGVGANENILARAVDGACGHGLARDIRSAYKWLSDHYVTDDHIFIIGFSRGAFTARSLVGMLSHCGLPSGAEWSLVQEAWQLYRLNPKLDSSKARQAAFRAQHGAAPKIHFLGVWDTVGALGIPERVDLLRLFRGRYTFHDLNLSPSVEYACHALAIDEERDNFFPTLWDFGGKPAPENVEQVWFPGVHADVGGGYRETQLSDLTLAWVMGKASAHGAVFKADMERQVRDATANCIASVQGVMHHSLSTLFRYIGYRPRAIPQIAAGGPPSASAISDIALERQATPPIAQAPYRPDISASLERGALVRVFARPLWNWTGIYLQKGEQYQFRIFARQTWVDWYISSDARGRTGRVLDKLMSWTKRVRDANFFELCGAIVHDGRPSVGGVPPKPIFFRIGTLTSPFVAPESGYLYCFANDAPGFYWNNRGSVDVEVRLFVPHVVEPPPPDIHATAETTAAATSAGGSGSATP